jgi:hypothetical protein
VCPVVRESQDRVILEHLLRTAGGVEHVLHVLVEDRSRASAAPPSPCGA